jgi:hypothetical protein
MVYLQNLNDKDNAVEMQYTHENIDAVEMQYTFNTSIQMIKIMQIKIMQ